MSVPSHVLHLLILVWIWWRLLSATVRLRPKSAILAMYRPWGDGTLSAMMVIVFEGQGERGMHWGPGPRVQHACGCI